MSLGTKQTAHITATLTQDAYPPGSNALHIWNPIEASAVILPGTSNLDWRRSKHVVGSHVAALKCHYKVDDSKLAGVESPSP
jgi:hypothetical protein